MEKEFFEKIKEAGIPFDNHESDLYIPNTPEVRAILEQYPTKKEITTPFIHQVKKEEWLEVPFAYLPYWEAKNEGRKNLLPTT